MSEVFKLLTNQSVAGSSQSAMRRAVAVASALELIHANVSNHAYVGAVEAELENLTAYADKIEAALDR